MKEKIYKCACCGYEKKIKTNHYRSCFDYCQNCSWKAFAFGKENSIVTPIHRHSRKFECMEKE